MRLAIVVSLLAAQLAATVPVGCAGSTLLGSFELVVRPFSQGPALPLKSLAAVPGGSRLIWSPAHLSARTSSSAQVAVVLVPASDGYLTVLEPRPAKTRTEWQLPERPRVIALVYGPQGLSEGKIKSLVSHNQELLRELAEYAEQSSQVESLVQQLADAEQSGGADAVLKGVSSKYGVDPSKLNAKTSTDQQAAVLLKVLLPASSAYDPLATTSAQAQQSGGLAAAMAGLFFGNPVGLATGGVSLLQNLESGLFPSTEFRTAFAQSGENNGLALCTKNSAAKSRTRFAYLWAYQVPEIKKPAVSLAVDPHLPFGSKSTVAVKLAGGSTLTEVAHASHWLLVPVSGGASIPVELRTTSGSNLEMDLSKVTGPPGDYHLSATWDWGALPVAGTLHLHAYGDFKHVTLAPEERNNLVEGNGDVGVNLSGEDFEFLDKAEIELSGGDAKHPVRFKLPLGPHAGPQNSVELHVDTAKRGSYQLLLAQSDGVEHAVPITVLPPNPTISNLPIRLNLEEAAQAFRLEGNGIDRIESVSSDAGEITGGLGSHGWSGRASLKSGLLKGRRFAILLKVKGLDKPVTVPDAIEIVGPRPRVQSVQKSLTSALGIEVGADELPSATRVGLALTVNHLNNTSHPRLELGCATGESRQPITLSEADRSGGASVTFSGPDTLYLEVDPGTIGYAGCQLSVTVVLVPEGRSDPFIVGRVIRVPRLEKFTLSTEKVGDSSYAGTLEGRDLDVIERVGWDAQHGEPIQTIPTPDPGNPGRQSLRVVLPWPAPGPHAPLYVWLRGAAAGRKTAVTY